MHKSGYVQDERYTAGAWMHRSGYVQDERYTAGAWMHRSSYVQEEQISCTPAMTTECIWLIHITQ